MHSLNGNTTALERELKKMQSSFGGEHWNSAMRNERRNRAPAPIVDVADSDDDEEFERPNRAAPPPVVDAAPKKIRKNRRGKKQKQHAMQIDEEEDDSERVQWVPNAAQTIGFEQVNRHGSRLEPDEVEEIRTHALCKNIAVMLQTECRFDQDKTSYLRMKHHHSFFACPTLEQRINAYLRRKHKKEMEISEDPINTEAKQEADRVLNQAKELLSRNPAQFWKGGMALYVNEAVFPVAQELESSPHHILVSVTDLNNQQMLLLAVYGPADSASANNLFFSEIITNVHEKHSALPILQLGDHNACFSIRKDLAPANVPPKKQTSKTAFEHLALSANLVDLRRLVGDQDSVYTFEKNTQNQRKYRANLDYFVANCKWLEKYECTIAKVAVAELAPEGYDHKPILLELSQRTKKVKQPKQPSYIRQLSEEHIDALNKCISGIARNTVNPVDAVSNLRRALQTFQTEHLDRDKVKAKKASLGQGKKRRGGKLAHAYAVAKVKAHLVHKAAHLVSLIAEDDIATLSADTELDKADTSPKARLNRTLRKLQDLGESRLAATRHDRATWLKDLGAARKQFAKVKRGLLRKMQRTRIQSHVRALIESFATEPRKFYRKISNMLNKKAAGLTAVYTTDENGSKVVTSSPEAIQSEVHSFYTELYRSRGPENNAFEEWLTRRTPTPESNERVTRPVTVEEIKQAIGNLANNKACGEDNLPAELYKAVIDNERFLDIMHDAVKKFITGEERIPAEWRVSHMILLHKSGDRYDVANYRPITLVNVVYKVYATILTARLSEFLETNQFLHRSQCGFRPDRGTAHKLIAMHAFLKEAQSKEKEAHIVSIDIKKAYDSVEHWIIKKALGPAGLNVPPAFLAAIMDTLEGTSVQVRVGGGLSKECSIERGVRQGDPISPMLFNVAIDLLLQRLEASNLEQHDLTGPHAYADDVDLAHFSHAALENSWQQVLAFLHVTHLEANAKKTTYARNGKAEVDNHEAQLVIEGQPVCKIGPNQPFRVLGVNFTAELDWSHEKSTASGKFKGTLMNVMKRAVTDVQLIEIVNVMQLSALSYGMVVVPYTEAELKKLNDILHHALRRRLRITDPMGWEDWMTLKREEGGFGLYNVRDLHDANCVNGFLMVVNGPDTPAKRALTRHMHEESANVNRIELPDASPMAHVIKVIEQRDASLHTAKRSANPAAILREICDSKLLRKWVTTLPMAHPTNEQLATLLLSETEGAWDVRDPQSLQQELNRISDVTERVVSLVDAGRTHGAVKEAVARCRAELSREATWQKLRHDRKLRHELGHDLEFVLDQDVGVVLKQAEQKTWRAKTVEEVEHAVQRIPDQHRDDVMLEPIPEHERALLSKILQNVAQAASHGDKTTDMTGAKRAPPRCQTVESWEKEWELSFTDGSRKTKEETTRAGWGAFLPQQGIKSIQRFHNDQKGQLGSSHSERVEGPQTNQRAELAAIYAVLRARTGSDQNQLIVTDSESSIKLIKSWKTSFSNNAKRKCRNRDLMRLIVKAELEIRGEVRLIHVFSHQDKADKKRTAKIATQRAEYGEIYDALVKGNEAADSLAGQAANEHTVYRNWADRPMAGVDDTYIVQESNFVDAPPHSWIKEGTQTKILQRQRKDGKARAQYLQYMPLCDKKRSFAAGARSQHASHATFIALAKLRFHAAPTAEKNARRYKTFNADNPYREFFRAFYPDDKCHACAKAGVAIKENTQHMLECPNRPDRKEASTRLWKEIYDLIKKNQSEHAKTRDVRQLRPFALRTQEALNLHSPGAGGGRPLAPALASVAEFPDTAAALGLIPKGLEAALLELGVEDAGRVADKVAAVVQSAVAADVKARHRVIATERGQKLLFRVHVLGLPAPDPA
jgi:ribonuclease HI